MSRRYVHAPHASARNRVRATMRVRATARAGSSFPAGPDSFPSDRLRSGHASFVASKGYLPETFRKYGWCGFTAKNGCEGECAIAAIREMDSQPWWTPLVFPHHTVVLPAISHRNGRIACVSPCPSAGGLLGANPLGTEKERENREEIGLMWLMMCAWRPLWASACQSRYITKPL